jgi:hypothetical protein
MYKVYECGSVRSDIIKLEILNHSCIAYCTKSDGLQVVDFHSRKIMKTVQNPYPDLDINACSLSPNSKFFAFSNSSFLYIADLESNKIVYTIETDEEDAIDILSFDLSSNYIFTYAKNGKITQYKIDSIGVIFKLYSFKEEQITEENFITAFAFYEKKFAYSTNNGMIFIIDLLTQTKKHMTAFDKSRIGALAFLDAETLLCANDLGILYTFFLNSQNRYKSIQTKISQIKEILIMPNRDYLMISGRSNIISLVDIKNFKILYDKYIKFHTQINKIALIEDRYLISALQNNKILYMELPSITILNSLIIHSSFAKAYELIEREPFLQSSDEHKKLEEMFERSYENAKKALIKKNETLAMQALDAYKDVKCKQMLIQDLFLAFKHYPRFEELFLEKKFALAYIICSKFTPLKKTPQYDKMEEIFKMIFLNAQRYMMQNNISKAKELLSEYNIVASKRISIKLLLTQNKDFIELLKAIQGRDFKTIYRLANKNESLKQIPNYISLNKQIQESLTEIEAYIKSGEIKKAANLLHPLKDIEHIKESVEDLYKKYDYVLMLQKAYEDSDFKSCYEILDMYEYLRSTELGALLEKHWLKLIQKCENFALAGNITDIEKTIGELIDIRGRSNKIKDLIKVGFYVKISALTDKKEFQNAEALIYRYIDTFGVDTEIRGYMKKFEKLSSGRLALTYISQ